MNKLNSVFKDFMSLPFTTILRRDDDGDVIARVKEFEGCTAHGQDELEAIANLEQVKALWIHSRLRTGQSIPLPEKEEEELPSGKWIQRVPRSMHKKLTEIAAEETVSLNQLVTSMLAEAIGRSEAMHKSGATINSMYGYSQGEEISPRKLSLVFSNPSNQARTSSNFIGHLADQFVEIANQEVSRGEENNWHDYAYKTR